MLAICKEEVRYCVVMYFNDKYVDSLYFTCYEDALETAYQWQSFDCYTHISRLFEVDADYKELDL